MTSPRLVLFFLSAGLVCRFASNGGEIDFNADVRPILSDKCFFCHGPDEEKQEAGLRLDIQGGADDVIESGDLMDRIRSTDPDEMMPPPQSKLSLTEADRETMGAWIESGAKYDQHWALELLPESVLLPDVSDATWPVKTLDRFVLSTLEDRSLKPNLEAEPSRWFRRVTFDLTGLPPTPKQIEGFLNAISKADGDQPAMEIAYQSAVKRLLESPAFGEHMAVAWLDAARYADSYGYQSDKLNTQWPYRDWVVNAFNDNLPYDQFLTWQIAGDLLDTPTRDQRLATAFNRIHRLNNEGGAVFEEWRLENVSDRVHTFGTAVLGLTMECCRCHDHKYDPIPMREYYALSAFFNSIDESGVYDRTQKVPCPSMLLPTREQRAALKRVKRHLVDAEQTYADELAAARVRFEERLAAQSIQELADVPDLRLALAFDREFDDSLKDVYHPSEGDRKRVAMCDLVEVENATTARLDSKLAVDRPKEGESSKRLAMALDGEKGVTVHGIEPLDRWTPFTVVVTMRETKRTAERSLIVHHTRGTDCGYNGWDLTIVNGYLESRMYRVWPGNAIGVRTVDPIPLDVWHQVSASYDGSSTAAGLQLFVNGHRLPTEVLRDEVKKSANVEVDHGGQFVIGQRFRARGLAGGLIDDVRLYTRNLTPAELQSLSSGIPRKPNVNTFASALDESARAAFVALNEARHAVVMAEEVINEIPVMKEMRQPRAAYVLERGQYDSPKSDESLVTRTVLSCIPVKLPDEGPVDRLALARWVTDSRHPLTARVAVNRFWGNFFAEPLVRTPENFGSQGELPTHPKLLDFLARDFINRGWDVKRLCREIVLSATYRQDSVASPDKLAADPTNRLLARGPAYRLAAEQIRDLALASSGLMNRKQGGPPVSPYQPGGDLWKESNGMSPPYQQSVGKSLYRRSLYSVWKRTAPLPNMLAFDSTSREVCTVKRSRTNTPLQALVLLNDVQFVEAARALAVEVMTVSDHDEARIEEAFLRLTGRRPDEDEFSILTKMLMDERDYFAEQPSAAQRLIAIGEWKDDAPAKESDKNSEFDTSEIAAMTIVCQAILNLDATIWKR